MRQEAAQCFKAAMSRIWSVVDAARGSMRDEQVKRTAMAEAIVLQARRHFRCHQANLPFRVLGWLILLIPEAPGKTSQDQACRGIGHDPATEIDRPRWFAFGVVRASPLVIARNEVDRPVECVRDELQVAERQVSATDGEGDMAHTLAQGFTVDAGIGFVCDGQNWNRHRYHTRDASWATE
jgi:hypothetical protein